MKLKKLLLGLISIVMLCSGIICMSFVSQNISMNHPEKRWVGDNKPYAYTAVFFPETEGVSYENIAEYRRSLASYIKEDSIEVLQDARPYTDSYSTYGSAELVNDNKGSTCKVNVCAYGGDYSFFHPMELLSGSFFDDDDVMKDKIVLDENAAWFLFGSADICGKYVSAGGKVFYISGVVKADKNNAETTAYGKRPRVYMSFDAYKEIAEAKTVTCYETVYPEPVTNYAYKKLNKAVKGDDLSAEDEENDSQTGQNDGAVIINITDRFKLKNVWKVLASYGKRSAQTNGIIYPYWENECRRAEDYCAAALLWCIIWGIVIVWYISSIVKCFIKRIKAAH